MAVAVKVLDGCTGAIEDDSMDRGVFFQEGLDVVSLKCVFREGCV